MASAASDVAAAAAAASEASSGSKGLAANTEVEQKDVESVGKDKSDKKGSQKKGGKRERKPQIDIDEKIAAAAAAMREARRAVTIARSLSKLEKRKKARLTKKAASLSLEDLERVATMKRCGLLVSADARTEQEAKPMEKKRKGKAKEDKKKDIKKKKIFVPVPAHGGVPPGKERLVTSLLVDGEVPLPPSPESPESEHQENEEEEEGEKDKELSE